MGTRRNALEAMVGGDVEMLQSKHNELASAALRMLAALEGMADAAKEEGRPFVIMPTEVVANIAHITGGMIAMAHHNDVIDAKALSKAINDADATDAEETDATDETDPPEVAVVEELLNMLSAIREQVEKESLVNAHPPSTTVH